MSYALIQLAVLILPGAILVWGLRLETHRYLYAIALSYSYYALLAVASIGLRWTAEVTLWIYLAGVMTLAMLVIGWRLRRSPSRIEDQAPEPFSNLSHVLWGAVVVVAAYTLYRWWAAPYLELPADVYRHLEYAQQQLGWVKHGYLNGERSWAALLQQRGGVWYSLFAWGAFLTGHSLESALPYAMWANASLFLLAVYFLALAVLTDLVVNPRHRVVVAVLAVLLTAAHFGINVFAYLRYYALAPTMLNMVVYMAGIATVVSVLRGDLGYGKAGVLLPIFLLAMVVVHTQEALFLLTMTFLMLGVVVIRQHFAPCASSSDEAPSLLRYPPIWGLLLMGLAALVVMSWAYLNEPRPTHWFGKVSQLAEDGVIASRVLYLTPDFQFIRVMTVWGLWVYALFIWRIRDFLASPYLVAGMVSPLFTVFNPIFVDFFLRMDGPHTLWRMLYMVPLYSVAAYLCGLFWQEIKAGSLWKRLGYGGLIVTLLALLLPIELGSWKNPYSRMTLAPVNQANSYRHWQDLIDFLNAEENARPRHILTDPVTGYAVAALTPHRTFRRKFFAGKYYKKYQFDFEDYGHKPLQRFHGWWLVVNDREGEISEVGEWARHWPADILKTSKYYGKALRAHLQANPERFKPLWSQGRISVYEISR